jgi:hypothetical protein
MSLPLRANMQSCFLACMPIKNNLDACMLNCTFAYFLSIGSAPSQRGGEEAEREGSREKRGGFSN